MASQFPRGLVEDKAVFQGLRRIAESFGVKGFLISERKQLQDEFKFALNYDGPVLINVRVRRGENCYPMVPPGKSNAQMVGYVNSENKNL